jgi:predicted ATPase
MDSNSTRQDFARNLRRALADLHDPIALRRNPMARAVAPATGTGGAGAALRKRLTTAVEALRPERTTDVNARAWRPYQLLQLRYIEGRTPLEVERALAVSTSQYYREHQAALEALTTILLDDATVPASWELAPHDFNEGIGVQQRHNLPLQITSFIGREQELAELDALVPNSRLSTLTGVGGCGKTRLAIELSMRQLDAYADGVWLVDFTALSDPGLVTQTVAFTLGIRAAGSEPILSTLIRGIRSKRLLLVLDNCEHLLQACAQVVDSLLRTCPHVSIVVTSREMLGITGETVFLVPPLEAPDVSESQSAAELIEYPAVKLFVERASLVATGFHLTHENADPVVEICKRLDGLPLAIELAAARTHAFTPKEIAARLSDRFRLLTGGSRTAPARHQTLRAMVDWSYMVLNEEEQRLFRRLSVFAGGSTADAVQVVCAEDGLPGESIPTILANLVERSLIVAEPADGAMRYRMLDTLREYAAQRLAERGQTDALCQRHARYYAQLAADQEKEMYGPRQVAAIYSLRREHHNFRAVLSAGARGGDLAVLSARVAASLAVFWFVDNYVVEARHWYDWVLSFGGAAGDGSAVRCLTLGGYFAALTGEHGLGLDMCDRAVAQAVTTDDASLIAWAYFFRCGTAFVTGDASGTARDARVGIRTCSDAGWAWGAAICNAWLGRSLLMQREIAESLVQLREAVDRSRAIGDPLSIALSLSFYGAAVGAHGGYEAAAVCFEEALELFETIGGCYAQASRVLVDWGALALGSGRIDAAAKVLSDALIMTNKLGRVPYRLAQLMAASAQVAAARECWRDAAVLLAAARELRARSGTQLPPERGTEEAAAWATLRQQAEETMLASWVADARQLDETAAVELAGDVLRRVPDRERS